MYALKLDELSKSYGIKQALEPLSFSLEEGSFLAIVGPNGAGKSTLLRLLALLEQPSSGELEILSYKATQEADILRSKIALLSHASFLYPDLSAYENLAFYAELHATSLAVQEQIKEGKKTFLADAQAREERIYDLLSQLNLEHRAHDQVKEFSQGMKQRLSFARCLILEPELLLLDEPYAGLDPYATQQMSALLTQLDANCTVVMVSHDIELAYKHADKILMLKAYGKAQLVDVEQDPVKKEQSWPEFYRSYKASLVHGV